MTPDDRQDSSVAETFGFDHPEDAWLVRLKRAAAPARLGRLGEYELLEEIGRGAQGVVFKAVQPHTRRAVALKRLAAGSLATTPSRARFEREVEAACLLDHPGVVTVHGVEMLDGQPVLAMEWVDGLPIDRWADGPPEQPRREVLAVFAQACDAVAHAHRRGVLHRDIKPSNVLVDVQGRARVLDFGLAKLLPGASAWAETSLTRPGGFLGTPAYAPPEALDDPDSVDTRGDVYALGVILYRLLAGAPPFSPSKGVGGMLDQVRRGIARPPSAHRPDVGPELDAIVLKAASTEPDRRYGSADELAADVRRYLAGEAVQAHPPGRVYLARKFARRHRTPVAIVAGAFVLTAVLAATATVFAVRLAHQQDRLRSALSQVTQARAEEARARAAAEASDRESRASLARARRQSLRYQAATQVLEGLLAGTLDPASDEPEGGPPAPGAPAPLGDPAQAARVRRELARRLVELGLYEEALEQSGQAVRLAAGAEGEGGRPALLSRTMHGRCLAMAGRLADAERELREVVRLREGIGREGGPAIASARADLAQVLLAQGRPAEAEAQYRIVLEARPEFPRRPILARYEVERELAAALLDQGRLEEAAAQMDRALDLLKNRPETETDGPSAVGRRTLARIHHAAGRLAEAEAEQRAAIARWTENLGPDHPIPARESVRLARIVAERGRADEGAGVGAQAFAALSAALHPGHPWLTASKLDLARVAEARPDPEAAARLAQEACEIASRAPPGCEKLIAESAAALARAERARGADDAAARALEHARTSLASRLAPDHPLAAICAAVLGAAGEPAGSPGR